MKKFTLSLLLVVLSFSLNAQFNLYWENYYQFTVTSGFSNEVRQTATDASGNIFVLSDVTSDLDETNHPVSTTRYFVILRKLSPSGTLLVQKIINVNNMILTGAHDYKSAFALRLDGSNNVFIGYNTYNVAGANYDVSVTKYNNSLTTSWTNTFSTPANETGVDLTLRSGTAFLLFKSVSGGNTTYKVSKPTSNTSTPTALFSFDANLDVLNSIATSPTKNLYLTGYRLVSGTKVVLTASVNTSGGLKWKNLYNFSTVSGDDYGNKVILGNDGFVYVAGTTYENASNGNAAMLLRYNAANGLLNAKLPLNFTLGTNNNDNGIDIVEGASGVKFLGTICGNQDVVVYKISTTNGLVVNASSFYKPFPTSFNMLTGINIADFKVASSNNVYVTGSITGSSPSGNFSASYLVKFGLSSGVFSVLGSTSVDGDNSENYQGVGIALDVSRNNLISIRNFWNPNSSHSQENIIISDFSMSSLRLQNGSENSNSVSKEVVVFPNPASGIIYFKNVQIDDVIEVYDLSGKLVVVLNQVNESADISMLPGGIYLLKIKSANDIIVKKMVVE